MTFYWCALAGFLLIMVVSFIRGTKDKYDDFCVGAAIPIFCILLTYISQITIWLRPVTIDAQLRAVDLSLGLDGFALTRWLYPTWAWAIVAAIYPSLPLVMAGAWAFEKSRLLLHTAVIGAVLAAPIYLLFPAVGPQYAFFGYPEKLASPVPAGPYPRNCVPSMHFTWALLLAMNARNKYWKAFLSLYAVLMMFVTVAGGEHYFIDVLVAIPFTLAVQWISEYFSREREANDMEAAETKSAYDLG
jgi:hypothetical protein